MRDSRSYQWNYFILCTHRVGGEIEPCPGPRKRSLHPRVAEVSTWVGSFPRAGRSAALFHSPGNFRADGTGPWRPLFPAGGARGVVGGTRGQASQGLGKRESRSCFCLPSDLEQVPSPVQAEDSMPKTPSAPRSLITPVRGHLLG